MYTTIRATPRHAECVSLCDGGPKELEPAILNPSHFTHIISSNSLDEAELPECLSHAYAYESGMCVTDTSFKRFYNLQLD